ncbi:MAG: gamma carbonic anhydrase family protein [Planctomycetota bacterium]|jgi:carbonic anhydrase/acetyltransferase-like protein (isoleucine patch superfamily)
MKNHPLEGKLVKAEDGYFAAASATIVGEVEIGKDSSIWFGAVLRGDDAAITVGQSTSLQDMVMVHPMPDEPTEIGDFCTVGHRAILHGKKIGRCCVIGMGAILLGGSEIGEGCIIAAGSVVKVDAKIPPQTLVAGNPGRAIKQLPESIIEEHIQKAKDYVAKANRYL